MTNTTATDLWRLADEAERRKIRILIEPISGEHFATSASDPALLYRVTGFSCTCKGFVHWQRCTHHAALLAHLGWLPDPEPDPLPPAPAAADPGMPEPILVACPCCRGSGRDWAEGPDGLQTSITCPICEGWGQVEEVPGDPGDDDRAAPARPGATPGGESATCRDCLGAGYRRIHLGGELRNWVAAPCNRCGSTGRVPALELTRFGGHDKSRRHGAWWPSFARRHSAGSRRARNGGVGGCRTPRSIRRSPAAPLAARATPGARRAPF